MTKADIIESVYAHVKLSKKESVEIVEFLLESMKNALERGENVKISGFGSFHVRIKESRLGRNPQTGGKMKLPARRVLAFRASQVLKNVLNAVPTAARAPRTNGRLP